jgi:hypothetical protein
MLITPTAGWETEFIRAIRTHLNVVIPVTTLSVKILVRVFSRDDFKEVIRSCSNLPLELMLIAISFMLGALSGISENYIARFPTQSDADLFAAVAIIAMFFISLLVNKLSKFLLVLFGKLYFTFKQFRELSAQPVIPGTEPSMAQTGRILWAMVYCILMVSMLLLAFGISSATLAYVLHLIQ